MFSRIMYAINLNNCENLKKFEKDETVARVQSLPAKVQYNGKVNVEKHFNIYSKQQDDHLTNALRGHLLQGKTLQVPQNLFGVVVKGISSNSLQNNVVETASVTNIFDKFILWNYDTSFSKSDVCTKISTLSELSTTLHAPVEETDLEDITD